MTTFAKALQLGNLISKIAGLYTGVVKQHRHVRLNIHCQELHAASVTKFVTLLYISLNVMSICQHHRPVRAHLSRQLRNQLSLASWRHQNFVQKASQIQNKATPLLGKPHKMAATFTHKLCSQHTKVRGWLIGLTAGRNLTSRTEYHSTKNNHSKQVYNIVPRIL